MPQVGFEATISAGERPQTYALDCTITGTGLYTIKSGQQMFQRFKIFIMMTINSTIV